MIGNHFYQNTNRDKTENRKTQNLCRFVFFFALFCVAFTIFAFIVNAQEPSSLGLSVAPQVFELDIFPGEKIEKKIELRNLSDVPMPILVKVTDFTAKENSGEMEFDESLEDPSIASRKWFEIENPNFILEAKEEREVKFSINVPKDAEPGSHYSVMLFEPQLPSFYFKPGQPKTVPVVGVLFLLSVKTFSLEPEVGKKLEVVEFSIPKEERIVTLESFISRLLANVAHAAEFTIVEKSPSKFILRIKNNDIYHIKPYGKVLIYNIFGKKVGEAKIPQKTILPGKVRAFPVEFSPEIPEKLKWLPASISNFLTQNLFFGRYQARLEIEAKTPLSTEVFRPAIPTILTFFSLPWKFWLSLLSTLALFLFFIVKYRKRIVLALKTLIGC
jgi:hypothetical protein